MFFLSFFFVNKILHISVVFDQCFSLKFLFCSFFLKKIRSIFCSKLLLSLISLPFCQKCKIKQKKENKPSCSASGLVISSSIKHIRYIIFIFYWQIVLHFLTIYRSFRTISLLKLESGGTGKQADKHWIVLFSKIYIGLP